MVIFSDVVKNFVNNLRLGYVATVSSDNTANLSPKGTIVTWNDDRLVFANIKSPKTIANLRINPSLEINMVDPLLRKGYRFKGHGKVVDSGATYDEIIAHYKKIGIKSQIHEIVLVSVDKYEEVISPLYGLGYSEDEIKEKSKKQYFDL